MKNEKYEEQYGCFLKTKLYASAKKKYKIAKISAIASGIGTAVLAFVCPPAAIATGVTAVAAAGYAVDQYGLERDMRKIGMMTRNDLVEKVNETTKKIDTEFEKFNNLEENSIEQLIIKKKSIEKIEKMCLSRDDAVKRLLIFQENIEDYFYCTKNTKECLKWFSEFLEKPRNIKAEIEEKLDKEAQKEIEKYIARLKNTEDFVALKEIGDKSVILFEALYKNASTELTAKMKELREEYYCCVKKLNNKEEYIKAYTDFAEEKIKMLRLLELHSLGDVESLLSIEKSIDKMEEKTDLVKSGEVLTFCYLHHALKKEKGESEVKELIDISFVQEFAKMWSSNKNVDDFCQKYLHSVKVLEKIDSKYDFSVVEGCNMRDRYMAHVIDGEVDKNDLELYESIRSSLTNKQKETNDEYETEIE